MNVIDRIKAKSCVKSVRIAAKNLISVDKVVIVELRADLYWNMDEDDYACPSSERVFFSASEALACTVAKSMISKDEHTKRTRNAEVQNENSS